MVEADSRNKNIFKVRYCLNLLYNGSRDYHDRDTTIMREFTCLNRIVFLPFLLLFIFCDSVQRPELTIQLFAGDTVYYIDSQNGNDSSSGKNQDSAWKSLDKYQSIKFGPHKALLLKCGGRYRGNININGSGTAENPIIITSYGSGAAPSIESADSSASCIDIDDQEYITLRALRLTKGDFCVHIRGGTKYGTLSLSGIEADAPSGPGGIIISERENVLIENCRIHGSAVGSGIIISSQTMSWQMLPCKQITIEKCAIFGNYGCGIYANGHGISINHNFIYNNGQPQTPRQHNLYLIGDSAVVKHNIIEGCPGGDGFRFEGGSLRLKYNFFNANKNHAISLYNDLPLTFKDNEIAYNIIVGTDSLPYVNYGINISRDSGQGAFDGVKIFNNSIAGRTSSYGGIGLFSCRNVEIFNNCITMLNKTIWIEIDGAPGLKSDYNCLYSTRSDKRHLYDPHLGVSIALSAWKELGYDSHSIESEPQFISATPDSATDFALKKTSPCINMGISLGENVDFFDTPISAEPDIGACEYPSPANHSF
jgi:hypothetical protein